MRKTLLSMLFCIFAAFGISAQTTAFTYQGSLKDGANPANGNHDFHFTLFDAVTGGTQIGPLISGNGVPVTDGVFGIRLDFGNVFPGAGRFLQISVRPTGGGAFTPLTPRQPISSAPYSVKSLNAENATTATTATTATNSLQLGGVPANQYVLTTADIINAGTQYNLGGNRILSTPGPGADNLFVGSSSGAANTSGFENSFFGRLAGGNNTSGIENAFFGGRAGQNNVDGGSNSFFGNKAGSLSTSGSGNAFFGRFTGALNSSGSHNTFIGAEAGQQNTTGSNNTAVGYFADIGANNLTYATAIGALSFASLSNSIYLGRSSGADTVRIPGLLIANGSISGSELRINNVPIVTAGTSSTSFGSASSVNSGLTFATAIGSGSTATQNNSIYLGRPNGSDAVRIPGATIINGSLVVDTLGGADTSNQLCRNSANRLALCSASSLRFKTNIGLFDSGLSIVKQLKPITFDWKESGSHDFGLGAEDVAAVAPMLAIYGKNGEVDGVKYDRIGVVLVNAVQEQQKQINDQVIQIETQQKQLDAQNELNRRQQEKVDKQQVELEALKMFICSKNQEAQICVGKQVKP